MGFADSYLSKHAFTGPLIEVAPAPGIQLIVVIPSLNEPELLQAVKSLLADAPLPGSFEIIIILNTSESVSPEIHQQHLENQKEIETLLQERSDFRGFIHAVRVDELPDKHAGVGLARKIGMDEAVRRFNHLSKPNGIICAFDADSTADEGFLKRILYPYKKQSATRAAVHYFEHPLEGSGFSSENYSYIGEYELFLRYFLHAVRFTGYPMAYHTVGSSFSVRADVYCKAGGMNKRKAGEDFYFLQKIFVDGNIEEITTVCIHPSPRSSDRVPFGTGRAMSQMLAGENWKAYNPLAFIHLQRFFSQIPALWSQPATQASYLHANSAPAIQQFISLNELLQAISEIQKNTASQAGFVKRFFQWFNHFKIIRFLNESHPEFYQYLPVFQASAHLLTLNDIPEQPNSVLSALQIYRDIDRHIHPKYLSFCRNLSSGNDFVKPESV